MDRYCLSTILVALLAVANSGQAAQLVGRARPSQKWSIANGQIIGIGGKCLDVRGSGTADTTPLILATCLASPSQQWSVQ